MPTGMRRAGQVVLLPLLVGCASGSTHGEVFDYVSPTSQAATAAPPRSSGRTERPRGKSVSTLLGPRQAGPGYAILPEVTSDGRYDAYTFATDHGTYVVTGNALARRHIQELIALDTLRKHSVADEFVHGVGSALTGPVETAYNTVTEPVDSTKTAYANVQRKLRSARHSMSEAGEFISTFGEPEKERPDRESDGLIEKLVERPKAKRRLARALMVDPYTHFVPLADELDKVASYSTVGAFGVSTAVGFVPGAAGTIISGLNTLDSFTERTLDLDPGETATVNRERMKSLGIPEDIIKKLLLNDRLTPSEKVQAVGYLHGLSDTPGLDALASFVAGSATRHDAFAALLTLGHLAAYPPGDDRIRRVDIMDQVPVLTTAGGKRIAIFTADELAWTPRNADHLSRIGKALKDTGKENTKKQIRISGDVTRLAKRELQRQGWIVTTDSFNASR